MKKTIGIILIFVGIAATAIGLITFINIISEATSSVSIIGGADGPTSIFIAGKLGESMHGEIIIGIVVLIIGFILLRKERK